MISRVDLAIVAVMVVLIVVAVMRAIKQKAQERRSLSMTHAVLIKIPLSDDSFGAPEERERIHQLKDRLREAILENQAGEFDGDEFGEGGCTLYMYGWDADKLFQAIQPLLEASALPSPSFAIKRFGPAGDPNAREERIKL